MTNREVLAKFLKETFNIEIKDNFYIRCNEIRCPGYGKCKECPGDHYNNYFWDKEFINDKLKIDYSGKYVKIFLKGFIPVEQIYDETEFSFLKGEDNSEEITW